MKQKVKSMAERLLSVIARGEEIIVFDTETTGFSGQRDHLLSLSALKGRIVQKDNQFLFEETARMDQFFNPQVPIPQNITDINHINNDTVRNCPPEKDCRDYILPFFGTDSFLAGHNVAFDIRFTSAVAQKCGWEFSHGGYCDTLDMAKELLKDRVPSHKLCELASYYHAEDGLEYHNSIDDVIATVRVLCHLIPEYLAVKDIPDEPEPALCPRPEISSCALWEKNGKSRVYIKAKGRKERMYYDNISGKWIVPADLDMEYLKKAAWEQIKKQPDCGMIYAAIKGHKPK